MALQFSHVINNACMYVDHDAESLTQDDCTHGDVRLEGTPLRSQGVVEVCIDSHWGRVCRDRWGNNDAKVACNQLGYGPDGNIIIIIQAKLIIHGSKMSLLWYRCTCLTGSTCSRLKFHV